MRKTTYTAVAHNEVTTVYKEDFIWSIIRSKFETYFASFEIIFF